MLLTDEKFYLESLNTDIPALALAAEHWMPIDPQFAKAIDAGAAESLVIPEIETFVERSII